MNRLETLANLQFNRREGVQNKCGQSNLESYSILLPDYFQSTLPDYCRKEKEESENEEKEPSKWLSAHLSESLKIHQSINVQFTNAQFSTFQEAIVSALLGLPSDFFSIVDRSSKMRFLCEEFDLRVGPKLASLTEFPSQLIPKIQWSRVQYCHQICARVAELGSLLNQLNDFRSAECVNIVTAGHSSDGLGRSSYWKNHFCAALDEIFQRYRLEVIAFSPLTLSDVLYFVELQMPFFEELCLLSIFRSRSEDCKLETLIDELFLLCIKFEGTKSGNFFSWLFQQLFSPFL